MPAESVFVALGIKPSSLLAGLLGAVLALPYMPSRRWWEKVFAVFGGMVCSAYLAPLVADRIGLGMTGHNATCFVVGVMGINIVSGLFGLSDRFRRNPERFLCRRK